MGKWPERYRDLVLEWLEDQWNRPSRSDYYAMRISQRIQQGYSKKAVSIDDQMIKFAEPTVQKPIDPVERSKAIWIGGVKAAQQAVRESQWPRNTK
jgi:hypothetical protein